MIVRAMQSPAPSISDYELLRQIGRGAYGEVWLARSVTGVYRAVKIVYRDRFEDARPFEREFTGIKRFEPISRSQQNLIDVLHVGRKDELGFFYYVMELADPAEGDHTQAADVEPAAWVRRYRPKTLRELLAGRKRLPIDDCLPIALGLARAAKHLHDHGLIHRDIKPSNVIFVNGIPKLADIGLVSGVEESRSFVGTEGFVPPEGPGTPAADLFSLGKVFYEMSNGRDRLEFPKLPDDLENIPRREALLEFNEVVLKACHAQVKQRYSSTGELLDDLLLLHAGRSVRRLRLVERRLARLVPLGLTSAGLVLMILVLQHFRTKEAQDIARTESRYRRQAEAQELSTRQLLYAADMNLAHQAYAAGDLGRTRSLLAGHISKTGAPDLRGFEWRYYWGLSQGDQFYTFPAEAYAVAELAFSRDGQTLAAAAYDHRAELWDIKTRQLLHNYPVAGPVENVGLSADGKEIAMSDSSGSVDVKDISTGRSIFHFQGTFCRLAISPTQSLLALGGGGKQFVGTSNSGPVTVWNYQSNHMLYSFPEAGIYVAFSPDGQRLATGSWNGELKLWDLKDGHLALHVGPVEKNFGMSFSPDGQRLAVGDQLGFLHVWDAETGRHLTGTHAHQAEIFKTAYSPDGRMLASVSADQTVRLWDADTLTEIKVLRGHASEVWGLAFSCDGRTLATCGKDGTIRLWDTQKPAQNDVLTREVNFWNWPVFSKDGSLIAVGEKKAGISIWQASDGTQAGTIPDGERPLAFVGKTHTMLALGHNDELQQWEFSTTNSLLQKTIQIGVTNVRAHVYFPESRLLITGDRQGDVRLWDADSGLERGQWKAHPGRITSIAASPDHTLLATASEAEDEAKIWDLTSRKLRLTLRGHKMSIFSVAFSPDGHLVATASLDDTCALWDVATGQQLATLAGHKGGTYSVAFSADGKTIAVGGGEGELKLWNVNTRRDMMTLAAEQHAIFCTVFAPDGRTLATVSFSHHTQDCSLKLWHAPDPGN